MRTCIAILLLFSSLSLKAQVEVKTTQETKLLDCQGIEFAKFDLIPIGSPVKLTDFYNGYFTALYSGKTGYIYYPYLNDVAGLEAFKTEHHKANLGKDVEPCLLQQYKKRYGNIGGLSAYHREPWIGMSGSDAIELFGQPKSINKTTTANNKGEQWVYDNRYLYFDNGSLTAIQETTK